MKARAAVAALMALLAGCARAPAEPPHFSLALCEQVKLVDAATGAAINGAEDLDIDRENGRLFISAYDRRAAEKAAASRAADIPQGGLYAVDLAALTAPDGLPALQSLITPSQIDAGLRPHGLAFDQQRGALSFINRGYVRDGKSWRREIEVVTIDLARPEMMVRAPAPCSANDLTFQNGRRIVTLDHGGCGWSAAVEDITGARRGRVIDDTGDAIEVRLGFPNGAVTAPGGALVVAATRERALHVIDATAAATRINLGAAPDNLTLTDEGRVVAAVHPDLFALGLQRKLGLGRSPSRVVEIDLASGDQRSLFDDPDAERISAATVAVRTQDLLIIGSVIDAGLVVCREDNAER